MSEPDTEVVATAPVEIAPDLIPTADQDSPEATYLDYDKSQTRVITYAVGSDAKGIYAETEAVAKIHCNANYGKILERNAVPGRVFYRVMK